MNTNLTVYIEVPAQNSPEVILGKPQDVDRPHHPVTLCERLLLEES